MATFEFCHNLDESSSTARKVSIENVRCLLSKKIILDFLDRQSSCRDASKADTRISIYITW